MASRGTSERHPSGQGLIEARLRLIRKRHRELILQPRELIAADLASEFDDRFEEDAEPKEVPVGEFAQGSL